MQFLNIVGKDFAFVFCNQIFDEYIFAGPLSEGAGSELQDKFGHDHLRINNARGEVVFAHMRCRNRDENHLQIAKNVVGKNRALIQSGYQIGSWQYYTVLVFGDSYAQRLENDLQEFPGFAILSKQKIPQLHQVEQLSFVEIRDVLSELTSLQLQVLLAALEGDYYSSPRGIYIKDIAEKMDRSRTSIQRVFRAAENRVMQSIIPQLLLYHDLSP